MEKVLDRPRLETAGLSVCYWSIVRSTDRTMLRAFEYAPNPYLAWHLNLEERCMGKVLEMTKIGPWVLKLTWTRNNSH